MKEDPNAKPTSVEEVLKRIQALAENAHWTSDRRWRIAELAAQGLELVRKQA